MSMCASAQPSAPLELPVFAFRNPSPSLPLSVQLSRLGGLTARVGQLLEALPASDGLAHSRKDGGASRSVGDRHDMHAVRLSMDGACELQPSRFADLMQPPCLLRCGCSLGLTSMLPAGAALALPLCVPRAPAACCASGSASVRAPNPAAAWVARQRWRCRCTGWGPTCSTKHAPSFRMRPPKARCGWRAGRGGCVCWLVGSPASAPACTQHGLSRVLVAARQRSRSGCTGVQLAGHLYVLDLVLIAVWNHPTLPLAAAGLPDLPVCGGRHQPGPRQQRAQPAPRRRRDGPPAGLLPALGGGGQV
jgi:hypothetical protein